MIQFDADGHAAAGLANAAIPYAAGPIPATAVPTAATYRFPELVRAAGAAAVPPADRSQRLPPSAVTTHANRRATAEPQLHLDVHAASRAPDPAAATSSGAARSPEDGPGAAGTLRRQPRREEARTPADGTEGKPLTS